MRPSHCWQSSRSPARPLNWTKEVYGCGHKHSHVTHCQDDEINTTAAAANVPALPKLMPGSMVIAVVAPPTENKRSFALDPVQHGTVWYGNMRRPMRCHTVPHGAVSSVKESLELRATSVSAKPASLCRKNIANFFYELCSLP